MMTSTERYKLYAQFTGKRKRPVELINRTENGTTFTMHVRYDKRFAGWSRKRRDAGLSYSFTHFYKYVLSIEEQEQITLIKVKQ